MKLLNKTHSIKKFESYINKRYDNAKFEKISSNTFTYSKYRKHVEKHIVIEYVNREILCTFCYISLASTYGTTSNFLLFDDFIKHFDETMVRYFFETLTCLPPSVRS